MFGGLYRRWGVTMMDKETLKAVMGIASDIGRLKGVIDEKTERIAALQTRVAAFNAVLNEPLVPADGPIDAAFMYTTRLDRLCDIMKMTDKEVSDEQQ